MPLDTTAGYCADHDRHYPPLERCPDCRAAKRGEIRSGSPKANTENVRIRAAEYRLCQSSCWEEYRSNIKEDPQVAVKFSAEAGKWAGRADELEMRILEIEHHQWMVEQDRLRKSGGS